MVGFRPSLSGFVGVEDFAYYDIFLGEVLVLGAGFVLVCVVGILGLFPALTEVDLWI